MEERMMAAITAAIEAYIRTEDIDIKRRFGQKLSPWKMAARRELSSRHSLTVRGNPLKMRLRRFSIL
ncbi:MAG: hypothetical protein JSV33_01720 [bacterium]|nr:MAG: hypothetical protein JSV33_01720 [bacterium]